MTFHHWGDPGVDWSAISKAAYEIESFCNRWGRFGGQAKEKFGTVRFYASFTQPSLHSLIYPKYIYSQFPKWLWSLDIFYITPVLSFFFGRINHWWQKKIYRKAYQQALKKYPHIREEILCCADYSELLEGL